ncbi:hypothetical protein TEA_018982 [Camellia sinensis var. sinensis]|uniref:KNOX2 domain-containing protein n=1 Tax=Camellia sinensis var. sinensis TaxID=542762 RepID=A0A4S4DPK4_CAMSN|nr:hypothetical protein TEA_018982 [Camellia sinensis var. sinensis]
MAFSDRHLAENTSVLRTILPEQLGQSAGNPPEHHHQPPQQPPQQVGVGPTWLNSAILRQQNQYGDGNFLNLHTNSDSTTTSQQQQQGSNQWLSRSILQRNEVQVSNDSMMAAAVISHESADLNNNKVENNGGEITGSDVRGGEGVMNWQSARLKSKILAYPLYEQLLSAQVACLRIATPVDQLPRIDAQLAQSQHVVGKYSGLGHGSIGDDKQLDQFMALVDEFEFSLLEILQELELVPTSRELGLNEQLQQHVRVHAMEAVMACWEIEQSLESLTGSDILLLRKKKTSKQRTGLLGRFLIWFSKSKESSGLSEHSPLLG